MKFLTIKPATISTLLLLVSTTGLALNPILPSEAKPTAITVSQNTQTKSNFTAVGKQQQTTGTATIVTENGKRYLVLSSDFSTPNGPDLLLILHRHNKVKNKVNEKDYINLSKLNSISGEQRYLIPDDIDLDDFQSVAIWCRQFNVTFAFAPLV